MTTKTPIRTVYGDANEPTGLAEFQSGETVGYEHGGTGLASLGTAGQVLQVNANTSAIEWATLESVDLTPYQTKTDALTSNNALLSLINDRMQVANVQALVSTEVSNLIDSAPDALNTLNELAAALGDDSNFATTITNSITTTNNTVNSNLANTNAYIATVQGNIDTLTATELSHLANTNSTITSLTATVNTLSSNAYVHSTFVPKSASIAITGDATGSTTFASNSVSITLDISDSGVTAGQYGSSSQVPVITVAADGRVTTITNTAVAGVESVTYSSANANLVINTSDGGQQTTTINLQPFDTDDLAEGATNQYFTNAKARAAFTGGAGIDITDGVISQQSAVDYGLIDGAVTITGDYGSI